MEQEIRAKYQPRPLESQVEFEAVMEAMNNEQTSLNRPFIDRRMEIAKERQLLNLQKQAINQQLSALSIEYQDIEMKAKTVNRMFHDLKHEWIVMNPREKFVRDEQ